MGYRTAAPQLQDKLETALTEVSQFSAKTNTVLQQCRKIPHGHSGWDDQHKEAEDPGEGTGRSQQGTLAAAKAAHTLGCPSRIACTTLAEIIIPIWVAAGHTSSLVSSSTEEMGQLESHW